MSIYTTKFWRDLFERVVSSAAGGALAALGTDGLGLANVDVKAVASVAAGTALVSLLKGLTMHATNGTASVGAVAVAVDKPHDSNLRA